MLEFKTSKGTFTVQLFDKQAPITVENFYRYADEGFFDGMIQSGYTTRITRGSS